MFTVINKNPKKDSKKKFYVQDVQERLNYFLDLLCKLTKKIYSMKCISFFFFRGHTVRIFLLDSYWLVNIIPKLDHHFYIFVIYATTPSFKFFPK